MDNKVKIMNRLKSDYDMLIEKGHEVVGVFLVGSQNYNLQYEGSDIDTKAILLPSFEDFLLTKKLISTTIELEPSKEHVDIKDIRLMFDNYRKQNCNFVETLFTEYRYMNPKYERDFQPMFDNREKIARYDMYKALNALSGMCMEKYVALEKRYPSLIEKIDKFGYDPKQLHHILRLNDFIKKITKGESYKDCMEATDRDFMVKVKKGEIYTLEEARIIAKQTCDETYAIGKEWMTNNPKFIDEEVDKIMTKVLIDAFRLRFKEELI